MHAIVISEPGGPEVLRWEQVPDPRPGPDEVLIEVAAAGVNRADLLQRQGFYPPPPGAPPYPGLECSGRIIEVGAQVTGWRTGDLVCALLSGGGYAERVVVPAPQLLPVPSRVSLAAAAALPEVVCTVYSNVFQIAGLSSGETLLVHGGGSGIGTMAIQLGKASGARVVCTAGDARKLERCRELGADLAINYREEDFVAALGAEGADVILDIMGASYLERNIAALAVDGRLAIIGLQGGGSTEMNLAAVMTKRARISVTTLRSRPVEQKGEIVTAVTANVWPLVSSGTVAPIVDSEVPISDAATAHEMMESGAHIGKILLTT